MGLIGCSGNGKGLDEFGHPLKKAKVELKAYFENIQAYTFEPECGNCHYGISAAKGHDLLGPSAYEEITGPDNFSRQKLNIRMVNPGNPDESYLYMKIADINIVEARMPKGRTPLSQTEADTIRAWILNGAPLRE
jgi:hypothetical protein